MRIAIIGGRLQGIEATYLAGAAGYQSVVIDCDPNAPASGLCDCFICGDALEGEFLRESFRDIDLVLPAIENERVLESASRVADDMGIPFLFDKEAYGISSSKLKSDRMFAEIGVNAPVPWPHCGFPVIGKPSGQSGSQGVQMIGNQRQLDEWTLQNDDEPFVLQQYLPGPSYSIEVIGDGLDYLPLQITELFMDEVFDCCRVIAPSLLTPELEIEFREISLRIARRLRIKGVFDVEIILHENRCKVLEIDARLPSQTPTAVYHSAGVNLLELMCRSVMEGRLPSVDIRHENTVLYQHIYVDGYGVSICGEHIMGMCGPLHMHNGFLGADIAVTNWRPGASQWVATLIYEGASREELLARQNKSVSRAEELQNKNKEG
ncbi:MAG: 3-methylornithine--L-lysine ligase PylC [Synergistaceae bacterium]|jgi:pyrrolysine biosynthesis protein PylC|nr:3-methylornithine--L-lysine ligase PylC [Synergistaceae bacterium]